MVWLHGNKKRPSIPAKGRTEAGAGGRLSLLGLLLCLTAAATAAAGLPGQSDVPEVSLSVEERVWLDSLGRPLRVGCVPVSGGSLPLSLSGPAWREEHGIPTIGAEYMALFSRMAGIPYQLKRYRTYADLLKAARREDVDVVAEISPSRERRDYLRFLPAYLEIPAVILSNSPGEQLALPGDFQGKELGAVRGHAAAGYLKTTYPDARLHLYPDTQTLIRKLAYNQLDYVVSDSVHAPAVIRQEKLSSIQQAGTLDFSYQLSMAVRRDMPLLAQILGKVQGEVPPGIHQRIRQNWLGLESAAGLRYQELLPFFIGILLLGAAVFLGILLWNRALARQVAVKTREYTRELQEKRDMERKLRLDERRLEGLLRLSQMEDSSLEEIGSFALEQMTALTESEVGFLSFFDSQGRLENISFWPDKATAQRYVQDGKNLERAGLWKRVLRKRKSLVNNDFTYQRSFLKPPPEGEPQIRRILMTPAFMGRTLQMAGGVGNKPRDYNDSDARQMELVLNSLNRLIREKKYRKGLEDQKIFLEEEVLRRSRELEQTRQDLVETNKMASLGGLVAGVAHEINNPLGVAITAASYLEGVSKELEEAVRGGTLTKSGMDQFVANSRESSRSILLNLNKAAELVRSFKGVASDQAMPDRRRFDLKEYLEDVLLSLKPKVKHTTHTITLECPEELEVRSYPGAFMQIVTNFVVNSLVHGFEGQENGEIQIQASERSEGEVCLTYSDTGQGMDSETAQKAFEPFFTTRRGRGGTGLGMHLVKNLVEEQLRGSIRLETAPGEGVTLEIWFPTDLPGTSSSLDSSPQDSSPQEASEGGGDSL